MQKIQESSGPCFNKVNNFHCSPKRISSCQAFPWQQEPLCGCCSVPKWHREQLLAHAFPLHYVSLSWLCAISTDTNTSWPPKSIRCLKVVQYLKNISSCCPGFQWFAEVIFLNCPPINVMDIYQELCQARHVCSHLAVNAYNSLACTQSSNCFKTSPAMPMMHCETVLFDEGIVYKKIGPFPQHCPRHIHGSRKN